MEKEIERKFLVKSRDWFSEDRAVINITQAHIDTHTRIRLQNKNGEDKAFITLNLLYHKGRGFSFH